MTVYVVLAAYDYEGYDIQLITNDRRIAIEYMTNNKNVRFNHWKIEEHEVV